MLRAELSARDSSTSRTAEESRWRAASHVTSDLAEASPQRISERLDKIVEHGPPLANDQHLGRHAGNELDARRYLLHQLPVDRDARKIVRLMRRLVHQAVGGHR